MSKLRASHILKYYIYMYQSVAVTPNHNMQLGAKITSIRIYSVIPQPLLLPMHSLLLTNYILVELSVHFFTILKFSRMSVTLS